MRGQNGGRMLVKAPEPSLLRQTAGVTSLWDATLLHGLVRAAAIPLNTLPLRPTNTS